MTRAALALAAAAAAWSCGGGSAQTAIATPGPAPTTTAERMLALLPTGPQLVIELDLARLRANPVVGALVTKTLSAGLEEGGLGPRASGLGKTQSDVLASADLVVLAAYGVGTSSAATITLVASKEPVAGGVPVGEYYALGPDEWTRQVEARAGLIAAAQPLAAAADLLALRERAMPPGAPGASLRVSARLSADARREFAIHLGMTTAPAQLSIWGDVVDDLAIVVDAEAAPEGGDAKENQTAIVRMEQAVKRTLAGVAELPAARALGIPNSLTTARIAVRGTWVRTILAIGPSHLQRVVERATTLLEKGPS